MKEFLKEQNTHPRDDNLVFYERGHKYQILTDAKSNYTSVTSWLHALFPKFDAELVINKMKKGKNWNPENKYWGKSNQEIKNEWNTSGKEACRLGTLLHSYIEDFMNTEMDQQEYTQKDILDHTHTHNKVHYSKIEWSFYEKFVNDFPDLVPFRTEWMIYDEKLKMAGSIDMVYKNADGSVSIYDWKRCKDIIYDSEWNDMASNKNIRHLPNTNFWHYSLQLNMYKWILETNYNLVVKDLFLVRLHPDNPEKTYELHNVSILTHEIELLVEERINNINTTI